MIQTLPYTTLLRYVYNELPASALPEIEEALQHDPELATACADLLLAQRILEGLRCEPRPAVSARILEYSRTFPTGS